ncbi:hypothetical protein [Streptomyces sp. AK02-01A]|uniref:hypothetical protein n=1 Tax=Streptomyces sp. AK02-01A TaxID=3028648 RepID=UPI0029BC85E1|nr:hypothetical protein [Streptomyces sp. AK02-01A]MDX3854394.1 hypothetical protein [Streptomyces sp. AK02-01A]
MLALRLGRGAHPLVLLRRLLVAAASAGVGFLLLCTLGWAMGHPAGSWPRLLWCLIPLAATVQFAVAVARTDGSTRPRTGLSAIGLGPARLTALAAASTAVTCALGSAMALLLFLHLRGDLNGKPFKGEAAALLAAGRPLPLGAALTLLSLAPFLAALATAIALRPRPGTSPAEADSSATPVPAPAPAGLPWGVALTAAGLAIETYATSRRGNKTGLLDGSLAGVLAGWSLTAVGLALAGPGITYLCGRLLQMMRPGAIRLLAGRALMDEARRIGRPLGVLCAVVSGAFAAASLYGPGDERPFGPLTDLGAGLIVGCAAATLLNAALEARQVRALTTVSLQHSGAAPALLRTAAAVRAAALLAAFAPLTWAVSALAAIPLAT